MESKLVSIKTMLPSTEVTDLIRVLLIPVMVFGRGYLLLRITQPALGAQGHSVSGALISSIQGNVW